jgi:hypothetical protein
MLRPAAFLMLKREGRTGECQADLPTYTADGPAMRIKVGKKIARCVRIPMARATPPNEKWFMTLITEGTLG